MTSRSHKKIARAGTGKPGKAVNLARPVRATRRSEPETSEPKSFTSGYTDVRELLLNLATEELAGAPVTIEEEEDAESMIEDEVDQASTNAVNDVTNDPDDDQKSLKTFGNEVTATSASRTAGWIKSLDVPHSSLKRRATRSPSPARSTHRVRFDTGSPLFVPEDEVTPNETPGFSDQTHTPATPAADDYYSEPSPTPSPTPSPHPRDEAITAGKEVAKARKDTRAHEETIEARKAEKQIAAEVEDTRKETGTAQEAQGKPTAKSTPDETAMLNIALFVNAINATHPTHPENTTPNPPRSGNAAEKFSAVADKMLNRQRTFVESFETWERETYDPGAYDPASTRALRTFIHGLRAGVDEMQGYADEFDTL